MKTIKHELYKLFSCKTLLILFAVLLTLNVSALLLSEGEFGVPNSAYRQLQSDLSEIPAEEKPAFFDEKIYEQNVYYALMSGAFDFSDLGIDIEIPADPILNEERAQPYIAKYNENGADCPYTGSIQNEQRFLEIMRGEAESVYNYAEYLDGIQEQARQMSVGLFTQKNTFANRNIRKTAKVYAKVGVPETLDFSVTEGASRALNSTLTDVCALLAAAFAAMRLICGEKETGTVGLLRTLKKGRASLVISKLTALFSFCAVTSAAFIVSSNIACGARFGFCELSTQIRFVKGFLGCTLEINLLQYLLLFFAAKTCAYFVIALLIFFVSIAARNNIVIYAVSGGIIAVEAVLYLAVNRFSVKSPIKYLNIVSLLQTNEIFGSYGTINFFGYPLGLAASSIVFAVIIAAALGALSMIVFSRSEKVAYSRYGLATLLSRFDLFRGHVSVSLFSHESYKIFIAEKGAAALAIMAALCFVMYGQFRVYIDENDGQFRQYAEAHGGAVTEQTDEFVIEEAERLERMPPIAAQRYRAGFNVYTEHYNYAKENRAEIVYDTGYMLLFDRRATALELLFQFVFMAVIFAPVFSSDSKTAALISSSKYGRKRDTAVRGTICAITTAVMFAAAHLPIMLKLAKRCGFDRLGAPAQSITTLRGFPIDFTILQFMIFRYVILLLISLAVMAIMLAVSRKMKSVSACTILLAAVFAVPCAGVMIL